MRVCVSVDLACCIRRVESANDIHQSTLTSRDLTVDDTDADQIDNIDLNRRRVFRESLTHFAGGGGGGRASPCRRRIDPVTGRCGR